LPSGLGPSQGMRASDFVSVERNTLK